MNYWFTSDTHFGHANIIKYSNRPYKDADEMDAKLIENWNSLVKPEDIVYHLGDFTFNPDFNKYFKPLNGLIHFIEGNHDRTAALHAEQFASYSKFKEIRVYGQAITLCHYALRVWNKSHYGSWHLYGHSHGTLLDDPNSRSFDVGLDCTDYFPLSFEQVRDRMKEKTWQPVDHHGESR